MLSDSYYSAAYPLHEVNLDFKHIPCISNVLSSAKCYYKSIYVAPVLLLGFALVMP